MTRHSKAVCIICFSNKTDSHRVHSNIDNVHILEKKPFNRGGVFFFWFDAMLGVLP